MEAAAARLGMELIKQYPAKEQAELKVKVQMPGSWFGGQLTLEEKYTKDGIFDLCAFYNDRAPRAHVQPRPCPPCP